MGDRSLTRRDFGPNFCPPKSADPTSAHPAGKGSLLLSGAADSLRPPKPGVAGSSPVAPVGQGRGNGGLRFPRRRRPRRQEGEIATPCNIGAEQPA